MAMDAGCCGHPGGLVLRNAFWHSPKPSLAGEEATHRRRAKSASNDGRLESRRGTATDCGIGQTGGRPGGSIHPQVSHSDLFAGAGFSKVSGDLQAVAVGATNLVFTIIAMAVIDRVGRKTLLLIGSVGTAACLAGVSVIFATSHHEGMLVWLLMGYIAFFGSSQGAVIWVYISEVFPNRVRAKGQSLGCFSHWFMNALISGIFPLMAASSGAYPFVFFAAMMVLQFFVVLFLYPETKGISLEEMQKRLGIA